MTKIERAILRLEDWGTPEDYGAVRELLAERDRLKELLASSRAQCDYAQQRAIRMQQVVDAAVAHHDAAGNASDPVVFGLECELHQAVLAYKTNL